MMKILDLVLKDLTRSFRNAFQLGAMVLAPLLLVGVIHYAIGGASVPPAVKVGVVNADIPSLAAPMEHLLGMDIRNLFYDENAESWIEPEDYADEVSALAALESGEIGVAVIIPQDFTERILGGERDIQIQIIHDPTLIVAPQVMQTMVIAILDGYTGAGIANQTVIERSWVAGRQPDHAEIQTMNEKYIAWYAGFQRNMSLHTDQAALVMVAPSVKGASNDPKPNVLDQMMVGQMAFFAFFSGAFSMMSILQEEEEGTLARLFTMPVGRGSILAGKFCAVFLLVLMQGVVLLIAAHYVFAINWGEPPAVLMALTGQVIVAVGLGVLLISFVKTSQQGGPVLGGGLTVLGMLGGLFTSGLSMPDAFAKLAVITPQGWVIKAWNAVLSGQPLSKVVIPFAVLMVMGMVMFTCGALMFRKRFA